MLYIYYVKIIPISFVWWVVWGRRWEKFGENLGRIIDEGQEDGDSDDDEPGFGGAKFDVWCVSWRISNRGRDGEAAPSRRAWWFVWMIKPTQSAWRSRRCFLLRTTGLDFSGEDYVKMMWRRTEFLGYLLKLGYNFLVTVALSNLTSLI